MLTRRRERGIDGLELSVGVLKVNLCGTVTSLQRGHPIALRQEACAALTRCPLGARQGKVMPRDLLAQGRDERCAGRQLQAMFKRLPNVFGNKDMAHPVPRSLCGRVIAKHH